MSKGATDEFWEEPDMPAIHKHALLRNYVPVFAGKTGRRADKVVVVDGYAGRGRHENGTPGSAEILAQIASQQQAASISWKLICFEPQRESFAKLTSVVGDYSTVDSHLAQTTIEDGLPTVLAEAKGSPLFLLLDPCGLGLSYERLVWALNSEDRLDSATETLLNFSMDSLRRIGGLLDSPHRNEASIARQDAALGGTWWHQYLSGGVWEPETVVREYSARLAQDTKAYTVSIPVRRKPSNQPLYYLVFVTRSKHGLWAISESSAKALNAWFEAHTNELNDDPDALFPVESPWDLDKQEAASIPYLEGNIAQLIPSHAPFEVVDFTPEILGDYFGAVRGKAVRKAIKNLHASGATASDGVGKAVERLLIKPPAT